MQAENEELNWLLKTKCQSEWERENEELKAKLNEWEKELQSNEKIINRLIKENEELGKIIQCKTGTIYVLKTENEELKNKNHTLQGGLDFQIKINEKLHKKLDKLLIYRKENEELKKENTELQEKFLDLNGKSYSYHKALEEIREHCDNYARTEDYVIDQTFNEFLELIYNKINGVLG